METTNDPQVIVIDDDCGPTPLVGDIDSALEFQDDLLTLCNRLFPQPVVDLSDSSEDKKGTSCSNVRCKTDDVELVQPTQAAVTYYNLPSKRLMLCKTCCTAADQFIEELVGKYFNKEPIYDCQFPPTNPVVLIDSDDSDSEDSSKPILPGISQTDDFFLKELLTYSTNEKFGTYNLAEQHEIAKKQIEESTLELKDATRDLINEIHSVMNKSYKAMESLYEVFDPKIESIDPLIIEVELPHVSNFDNCKNDILPRGVILRPKPQPGQRFYVTNSSTYSEWVQAVVIERVPRDCQLPHNGLGDIYRVKLSRAPVGEPLEKEVSESSMAYFNPPSFQLTSGTRIVTVINNQSRLFAGVVAEPPSKINEYRYLVFFDDGYAQYALHKNIRLVVKSKPSVNEYFTKSGQRFIKDYFQEYPERAMLSIQMMGTVRVMRKGPGDSKAGGSWHNCRVIGHDASLYKVLFLKENYSEWIYRGSPRLRPIYDHLNKSSVLRKRLTRGTGPVIHYVIDSSPESGSETDNQQTSDHLSIHENSDRHRRAVAKKSTNNRAIEPPLLPMRRNAQRMTRQQYGKVEVGKFGYSLQKEFVSIFRTLIPSNTVQPEKYRDHSCTPFCASVRYDERKTMGLNPLSVPSLYGFTRDCDDCLIFYIAPCGKRLGSMSEVLEYTSKTKILIGVDHFDFDPSVHIFDEFIVPPQHILIKDLSHGRENVPVPVVNSINAVLPDMMEYMTERRGLEGVHMNLDEDFLVGCDCTDNCKDKSKCACQMMTVQEAITWSKYFHIEKPEQSGYHNRRLPVGLPSGLWECNNKCKCCRKTCLNRVAQYPLKVKLQLFKTKKKGWGVRCINDIPCGAFICVYNGNILTEKNANEGGLRYGDEYFAELDYIECMEGTKANYEPTVANDEFFNNEVNNPSYDYGALDKSKTTKKKSQHNRKRKLSYSDSDDIVSDSDEEDYRFRLPQSFGVDEDDDDEDELPYPSVRQLFGKDESVYVMDAKTAGNIGRYFNHSCDPNVHVQSVFVDTHDLRFPWIAFFSLKYIKAGSELTWDYRYEPGKVPGKKILCYCGTSNCRKRLL